MLVVAVILLLSSSFFHTAQGDGTLEIQFNSYRHSASRDFKGLCCDSILSWGCVNDCDNYVVFCYRDYNPSNDDTCSGTRTTGKFDDSVTFTTGKNALKNNLDNPFSFGFSGAWKNSFSLKITIWDDDSNNNDDLVDVLRPGIAHAGVSSAWSLLTIKGKYSKTLALKWRVQCDANYYGDCSVLCVPQDSDATGHYTCDRTTGQRKCMSGWTGAPQCKTPICKTGCSKLHGSCTKPGQCTCDPGWKGNTCSDCVKKSGCKHGSCSNGNDCICQSHWLGPLCDQSGLGCNDHPCQNGGTCSVSPNSFSCACPSNFTGSTCNVDMNLCRSNPCLNGATCDNHANGFTCNCPSGYAGQFCSTDIDECSGKPCLHGHCSDFVNSFSCTCQSGYTGDLCNTDIDECADSGLNDCGVNTVCNNTSGGYSCPCISGHRIASDGHSCTRTECNHLDYSPSSTKVTYSNDSRWVDMTAQITCQDGYSMQPTSPIILSCLENGDWDKEAEKNVCIDINECEQGESPCGSGEVCLNTVGSHSCETAEPTQTSEPKATEGCLGDCLEDPARSTDKKNSSNLGLYIGVAAGFILLLIIIIVLLVFLRRRSKQGSIIIVPPPATQNNNSLMAMAMSMSACQVAVDEEHVAAKMKNIGEEPFYDVIGDGSRSAMPLPPPPSSSHAYEDMSGTAWRYRAPNPGYGSTIPYTSNASGACAETDTGAGAAPPAAATASEDGGAVSLANPTYDASPLGANGGPVASQDDYLEPDVKGGVGVGGRYTKCP